MSVTPSNREDETRAHRERALSTAPDESVLVVKRLDLGHEDAIRLKRMGICEGRQLQLVQKGDPLIVRVVGCRVGVSRRLAERVWVTPCPSERSSPPNL